MTAVPLPGMTWPVRHEVSSSLVLHPLWETQQDSNVVVVGLWAICRAECWTSTFGWKLSKETAKVTAEGMLSCLFLIRQKKEQACKGFEAGAYLLNNSSYRLQPSLQFQHVEREQSRICALVAWFTALCERGGTTSSSQYHWRSNPFILWLLLTLECVVNYNRPSVGDCSKLRQDMKRLWGMAVPVMRREQIERPLGQHTSIISIMPFGTGKVKGLRPGAQGTLSTNKKKQN